MISVEESDRDSKTQVQSKGQTKQNIDDTNVDKKEEREDGSSSVRADLYLELSPAQNLAIQVESYLRGSGKSIWNPSVTSRQAKPDPTNDKQGKLTHRGTEENVCDTAWQDVAGFTKDSE